MFDKIKSLFSKKEKKYKKISFIPTNEIVKNYYYKDFELIYSCSKIQAIKLLKSFKELQKFRIGYLYNFDTTGDDIHVRIVTTGHLLSSMDYAFLIDNKSYKKCDIKFDVDPDRKKGVVEPLKLITDTKTIKALDDQI